MMDVIESKCLLYLSFAESQALIPPQPKTSSGWSASMLKPRTSSPFASPSNTHMVHNRAQL